MNTAERVLLFKQVKKWLQKSTFFQERRRSKSLLKKRRIRLGNIDTSLITDMSGDLMATEEMTFQALRTGTLSRD